MTKNTVNEKNLSEKCLEILNNQFNSNYSCFSEASYQTKLVQHRRTHFKAKEYDNYFTLSFYSEKTLFIGELSFLFILFGGTRIMHGRILCMQAGYFRYVKQHRSELHNVHYTILR